VEVLRRCRARAGDAALPSADGANDEAADPARPRWIAGKAQTPRQQRDDCDVGDGHGGRQVSLPGDPTGAGGRGAPVLGYSGRTATASALPALISSSGSRQAADIPRDVPRSRDRV